MSEHIQKISCAYYMCNTQISLESLRPSKPYGVVQYWDDPNKYCTECSRPFCEKCTHIIVNGKDEEKLLRLNHENHRIKRRKVQQYPPDSIMKEQRLAARASNNLSEPLYWHTVPDHQCFNHLAHDTVLGIVAAAGRPFQDDNDFFNKLYNYLEARSSIPSPCEMKDNFVMYDSESNIPFCINCSRNNGLLATTATLQQTSTTTQKQQKQTATTTQKQTTTRTTRTQTAQAIIPTIVLPQETVYCCHLCYPPIQKAWDPKGNTISEHQHFLQPHLNIKIDQPARTVCFISAENCGRVAKLIHQHFNCPEVRDHLNDPGVNTAVPTCEDVPSMLMYRYNPEDNTDNSNDTQTGSTDDDTHTRRNGDSGGSNNTENTGNTTNTENTDPHKHSVTMQDIIDLWILMTPQSIRDMCLDSLDDSVMTKLDSRIDFANNPTRWKEEALKEITNPRNKILENAYFIFNPIIDSVHQLASHNNTLMNYVRTIAEFICDDINAPNQGFRIAMKNSKVLIITDNVPSTTRLQRWLDTLPYHGLGTQFHVDIDSAKNFLLPHKLSEFNFLLPGAIWFCIHPDCLFEIELYIQKMVDTDEAWANLKDKSGNTKVGFRRGDCRPLLNQEQMYHIKDEFPDGVIILMQKAHQVVTIPAGWPHMVLNIQPCTKLAWSIARPSEFKFYVKYALDWAAKGVFSPDDYSGLIPTMLEYVAYLLP